MLLLQEFYSSEFVTSILKNPFWISGDGNSLTESKLLASPKFLPNTSIGRGLPNVLELLDI